MTTVYKVVERNCERSGLPLTSAFTQETRVFYAVGKPTRPEVGLLYAFSTLEGAETFLRNSCRGAHIYKAEAVVSNKTPAMLWGNLVALNRPSVEAFWAREPTDVEIVRAEEWPDIVLCEEITLLEEVK